MIVIIPIDGTNITAFSNTPLKKELFAAYQIIEYAVVFYQVFSLHSLNKTASSYEWLTLKKYNKWILEIVSSNNIPKGCSNNNIIRVNNFNKLLISSYKPCHANTYRVLYKMGWRHTGTLLTGLLYKNRRYVETIKDLNISSMCLLPIPYNFNVFLYEN